MQCRPKTAIMKEDEFEEETVKSKGRCDSMYVVGEYICYPMHGAGRIEGIERREEGGELYYSLYFYGDNLKIMVPVAKAEEVGMRPICEREEAETVFALISCQHCDDESNWNRRYRANLDKMRSGRLSDIAAVLAVLSIRDRIRGVSAGEKKMMKSARRFLAGELSLAGLGSEEEVDARIEDALLAASGDRN